MSWLMEGGGLTSVAAVAFPIVIGGLVWNRHGSSAAPCSELTTAADLTTIVLCKPNQKDAGVSSSPFVCKLEAFLIDKRIEYRVVANDQFGRVSPNQKIPYVHYRGELIADSHFIIRRLIRDGRMPDPDAHLTAQQRAISNTIRLSLENMLYWILVKHRWHNEENWQRTKAEYFGSMPAILYGFLPDRVIRPKVVGNLYAVGTTRYSDAEVDTIAADIFLSLSTLLAGQQYFFGDKPSYVDYTAFGHLHSIQRFARLNPKLYDQMEKHMNLVQYATRLSKLWTPSV